MELLCGQGIRPIFRPVPESSFGTIRRRVAKEHSVMNLEVLYCRGQRTKYISTKIWYIEKDCNIKPALFKIVL